MVEQQRRPVAILRLKQVQERTGLSRSTIYQRIRSNKFPRQVSLGGQRAVGWIEQSITDWIEQQIAASRKVAS